MTSILHFPGIPDHQTSKPKKCTFIKALRDVNDSSTVLPNPKCVPCRILPESSIVLPNPKCVPCRILPESSIVLPNPKCIPYRIFPESPTPHGRILSDYVISDCVISDCVLPLRPVSSIKYLHYYNNDLYA